MMVGEMRWKITHIPVGSCEPEESLAPSIYSSSDCLRLTARLNLCLYADFLIFESIVYRGQPASNQAVWEVGGFWAALFVTALLAALCLKIKTQAIGFWFPQSRISMSRSLMSSGFCFPS
jgi:hypothetical protein